MLPATGYAWEEGKNPNLFTAAAGFAPMEGFNAACHQHRSETWGSAPALAPQVSQPCQFFGPWPRAVGFEYKS